jgi:hypothetical protein
MDTTNPQLRLQYASESISTALAAGVDSLSNFGARLSEVIPDVISGFKELVTSTSDQRAFLKLLEQHSYAELRYIKGYVPEGFNGKFDQLFDVLAQAVKHCATVNERVLSPYVTFLASFANGGDAIKSLDSKEHINAEFKKIRANLDADYACLFIQSNANRAQYGSLVDRNADWSSVLTKANSVENAMRSVNRSTITDQCRKAETYLDLIERKLSNGQLHNATPEVCKALAEGAEQAANEVAYVSVVYYRVLAAFNSVDQTINEVRRVVKA